MTPYTLTGAADWKMFVFMCGGIGFLLVVVAGLVGFMWRDLIKRFEQSVADRNRTCKDCREERDRQVDALWSAVDECCPRGGNHSERIAQESAT